MRAAQSGIAGFPQPDALGYINNFFHPHTGPIAPGQGFLPLGNLLTSDFAGPYNLSLLSVQENEIKGAPPLASLQAWPQAVLRAWRARRYSCAASCAEPIAGMRSMFEHEVQLHGWQPL